MKTTIAGGIVIFAAVLGIRYFTVPDGKVKWSQENTAPSVFGTLTDDPEIIYPLSMIPGGIRSDRDIPRTGAMAVMYQEIGFVTPVPVPGDMRMWSSFLKNGKEYWALVTVKKGEAVFADKAGNMVRGRCGNLLKPVPPPHAIVFVPPPDVDVPVTDWPVPPTVVTPPDVPPVDTLNVPPPVDLFHQPPPGPPPLVTTPPSEIPPLPPDHGIPVIPIVPLVVGGGAAPIVFPLPAVRNAPEPEYFVLTGLILMGGYLIAARRSARREAKKAKDE